MFKSAMSQSRRSPHELSSQGTESLQVPNQPWLVNCSSNVRPSSRCSRTREDSLRKPLRSPRKVLLTVFHWFLKILQGDKRERLFSAGEFLFRDRSRARRRHRVPYGVICSCRAIRSASVLSSFLASDLQYNFTSAVFVYTRPF